MRCAYPTLLIALATLFAACQKDNDPQQWVEVTTESYSGAKVVVDGVAATWADGDRLRVNGATATVRRIDGHAYIEATAVSTTGVNRALYPASLSDAALGADAATISLPAQYRYRTDASGHQLLEIPMAARSEGGKPLHFQHLTGALVFTISNELGRTLTLDHIIVQSNLYSLSGKRNIDFSNITATAPATPVQDTDRTVMLIFDGQPLPAGDSLSVTIPIAPVDSTNRFTVTVSGHYQGTRYTFNRAQTGSGDGSLVRNQLGYATTPMSESSTSEKPLLDYISAGNGKIKLYIRTPEDFALMAEAISNKWKCPGTKLDFHAQNYEIASDIDMQGYTLTPISSYQGEVFNGNGNTIRNLNINGVNGKCGLFAIVSKLPTNGANNPVIQRINLENVTLNYANSEGTDELHIAPLICDIASTAGKVTIQDCSVSSVTYNTTNCQSSAIYGGLVATSACKCTIQNCTVDISTTINQPGGFIYYGNLIASITGSTSDLVISNCTVTNQNIDITGTKRIEYGGFIGRTYAISDINNSDWTGTSISLNTDTTSKINAGGFIGRIIIINNPSNAQSSSAIGAFHTNNPTTSYGAFIGLTTYPNAVGTFNNCTDTVTLNGTRLDSVGSYINT